MKFKRLTALIMTGCTAFVFAACGNNAENPGSNDVPKSTVTESHDRINSLAWEGVPEIPMIEHIKIGSETMYNGAENIKREYDAQAGWVFDHQAENVNEPYTYTLKFSDGEKTEIFHYLMDVNKEGTLSWITTYDGDGVQISMDELQKRAEKW